MVHQPKTNYKPYPINDVHFVTVEERPLSQIFWLRP